MIQYIKGKAGRSDEIAMLKQTFGENWKEGMRKNPHIDRRDPSIARKAKQRIEQEKRKAFVKTAEETLREMRKSGKINSEQAVKLAKEIQAKS